MAQNIPDLVNNFFTSPAKGRNLFIGVVVILSFVGFGSLIFWNTRPEFQVLFSNLSSEDAGDMVNRLKERKIPYQLTSNGTTILIPQEQVYDIRLTFATEGLPKGGGVGFEVFDRTNLGTTDFVQKLNYQRALQGELSRTIRQIKEIEQARVHIVTPKESLFIEDQKRPTASVLIKTRSGMGLAPPQVEGIVNLVASAVEGLEAGNISIVDTSGKVLFKRSDASPGGQLTTSQFEYQKNIEEGIKKKVQGMLEEVLGSNKAIARIAADIDFQQIDITEEKFDPTVVLRSEQKNTEKSSSTVVQPSAGDAKTEGTPELKGNKEKEAAGSDNLKVQTKGTPPVNVNSSERQSDIRNYEVSKINKHTRNPMGKVTKVSTAVIVDGTYQGATDGKGVKSKNYIPRTPEEMKNLENIVKKAVGYSETRGDQVEVVNMPFYGSVLEEETKEEVAPVWEKYLRLYYKPVTSLVLALLFIFFVARPLLKKRIPGLGTQGMSLLHSTPQGIPQGAAQAVLSHQEASGGDKVSLSAGTVKDQTLRLAHEDPSKAARVVKTWLHDKG